MFLYNDRITDWGRGFKPLKAAKMGLFFAGSGRGGGKQKGLPAGQWRPNMGWAYGPTWVGLKLMTGHRHGINS
jgi:hypothetical protein